MTWYAAHVIMQVEFKEGNQTVFPVWENVYLLESLTEEEALSKAQKIGYDNEGDSQGSFYWQDKPAKWVFRGVRKLITLANPGSASEAIQNGSEITFSTIQFESKKNLEKFLNGEPVEGKFLD